MLRCLMVVKFSNAMAKKTSKQFQSFLFISLEFDFEQFRLFERLEFADSKQSPSQPARTAYASHVHLPAAGLSGLDWNQLTFVETKQNKLSYTR